MSKFTHAAFPVRVIATRKPPADAATTLAWLTDHPANDRVPTFRTACRWRFCCHRRWRRRPSKWDRGRQTGSVGAGAACIRDDDRHEVAYDGQWQRDGDGGRRDGFDGERCCLCVVVADLCPEPAILRVDPGAALDGLHPYLAGSLAGNQFVRNTANCGTRSECDLPNRCLDTSYPYAGEWRSLPDWLHGHHRELEAHSRRCG